MTKKVILYIATSINGFIARENGNVDWLDKFNSSEEDFRYKDFFDSLNTVVMGNTTYNQILTFGEYPYKNKNSFVFSNKIKEEDSVEFVNEDVNSFIRDLDPIENKIIWLVGGANLVNQFLKYNLINKLIIFNMPILIGKGIRLFNKTKSYKSGTIETHYALT